jgi:XTP/dITP diphosphohydrolase
MIYDMKKRKLVFATNNANKINEVKALLEACGPEVSERYEVLSLRDIGCNEDIPENSTTFAGNALQKAEYVNVHYDVDCFADDTGLEVEALNGEPGVHSARYAEGTDHDSEANMDKLLQKLDGQENRNARFRTVIALIQKGEPEAKVSLFQGTVYGVITKEKSGAEGFGYDPIFQPDGYDQTFAELGIDIKNNISHRAHAVSKLAEFLLNA